MLFQNKQEKFLVDGIETMNRKVKSGKQFFESLKRSTISSIFPFLSYEPENRIIVSSDAAMEGNMFGVVWAARSPLAYSNDSLMKEIRSSLSINLPRGSFIQFLRMDVPDISNTVDTYRKTHGLAISRAYTGETDRISFYQEMLDRTARFTDSLVDKPAFTGSLIHLSEQFLLVSLNIPAAEMPTEKDFDDLLLTFNSFESSLPSLGLDRITAEDFLSLWRRFLHFYSPWDRSYNQEMLLRDQIAFPGDGLFDRDGHLYSTVGSDDPDVYITPLSIKEWPDKDFYHPEIDYLLGDPLGVMPGCPDPVLLSWTAHIPDYHSKLSSMKRKQAGINYQAFGPMLRFVPALAYRKKGIDALMEFVESESDMILETALTAIVFSRNKEDAARAVSAFQTMSQQRGLAMRVDDLIPMPTFFNALPLFASEESIAMTYRYRTLSSTQASAITPVFGDWQGPGLLGDYAVPGGGSLVTTRRGHPAVIDIFSSNRNYNFNISGDAGSGKSVLAQQLLRDQFFMCAQVFVVETGESLKKLCHELGGTHIYFDESTDVNLNPFPMIEDFEDEIEQITALHCIMISDVDPLSKEDTTLVAEAVRQSYVDKGKDASPTDIQKFLFRGNPRSQMLGRMMDNFVEGKPYGHIFTGTREIDLRGDFIVLELGALETRPALQKVVLAQFMFAIQRQIYLGSKVTKRRRIMFVDEASVLFRDDSFAYFLSQGYRRARKHQAAFGVGTQNISDKYVSESTKVIAAQSAHNFYLLQSPEGISNAVKDGHLDKDSYLYAQLTSLRKPSGYSEFIYQYDRGIGAYRLLVDPYNLAIFTSSGEGRDFIFGLLDQGIPAPEAIKRYLDQFKPDWQQQYPPYRPR